MTDDVRLEVPLATGTPRCPAVHGREFDPLADDQVADPYPWLAEAQREQPVFHLPAYNVWMVTRHGDASAALMDTTRFSSKAVFPRENFPSSVESFFRTGDPREGLLVATDPPQHNRLRRIAQRGFTRPLVAAQESPIRTNARRLITGFRNAGQCEFVSAFAAQLPALTIAKMVGLPPESTPEIRRWAEDRQHLLAGAPPSEPAAQRARAGRLGQFHATLTALIEERAAAPKQDLASSLLAAAAEEDAAISITEVVGVLGTVLSGGITTTAHFLTFAVRMLAGRPLLRDSLRADPTRVPAAVEELLRLTPSARTIARVTTCAVELGGVLIPTGAKVLIHNGAAQRDEQVFTAPAEIRIDRADIGRHFAFGRGIHKCLGSELVRLQVRVALQEVLDALPEMALEPDQPEEWLPHLLTPGLERLRLRWAADVSSTA
ncbi:cytochrome P450 [Pseudonocardia sp.]|uniref:cytochrome P450 n=1 Tax=Pseudonocardia sp. TaxID=60912 RepID=UPI0031FC2275